MARYRYRAYDHDGNAANGEMEERSAQRVRQVLEERGLTVTEVHEAFAERGLLRVSSRLTAEELHLFTQQLDAIARSGLPLPGALRALATDVRSSRLKPALDGLQRDLEQGLALSEALDRRPKVFPPLFASLIRAGEAAGNLPGMLQLLTAYTARQLEFRATLHAAAAYPAFLTVIALGIVYFLLTRVVPIFGDIFREFGGTLPWPTQFWLNVAQMIDGLNWGFAAGVVATLGLFAVLRWALMRTPGGMVRLDALRMGIPMYGYTYYLVCVSRFARALSLLLASRTPVLEALELAAASSGSPLLARHVDEAAQHVAGGQRIADALRGTSFFGYSFCWLLGAGEDRGEAETTLESLADAAERQVQGRDRALGSALGPLMVMALGVVFASIVFALYLPIFTLGDAISGT